MSTTLKKHNISVADNSDLLTYINENCENVSAKEEEKIILMLEGIDVDDCSDAEEVDLEAQS